MRDDTPVEPVPISPEQALRLVEAHRALDAGRLVAFAQLLELMDQPVRSDPLGRDVHAILSATSPEVLAHLMGAFAAIVDFNNGLSAGADEAIAQILSGTEPDPTIN